MSERDESKKLEQQETGSASSEDNLGADNSSKDFSADPDWQALDAAFNASIEHKAGHPGEGAALDMPGADGLTESSLYKNDEGEGAFDTERPSSPASAALGAASIENEVLAPSEGECGAVTSAEEDAARALEAAEKASAPEPEKPDVSADEKVKTQEHIAPEGAEATSGRGATAEEAEAYDILPGALPPPAKRGFFKKGSAKEKIPAMPRLSVDIAAEPTFFSRLYTPLALAGALVLTAVFLLQVLPSLQNVRLLWFSDELRQADVLRGVFNGDWLNLKLNGQFYQEAPPLYFWFLVGLHKLFAAIGINLGDDHARLLFIGSAVSGLFFLWATLIMARSTANLDRRGCFAAGCVFLSSLFLVFLFHYSNIDLFFAAFIVLSQVFLYKALIRQHSPLNMALAFGCSAIALFTKGGLGLALPVATAVAFCFWIGRPQRLLKPDFWLGILFALLPIVLWLGSIWAGGDHESVVQMLRAQVWDKTVGPAPHSEPWWYYFAMLAVIWLPWSLLLLLAPWHKLFGNGAVEAFKSARHGQKQGLAFIWIAFLSGFILLSAISNKQAVYLVPLLGPLAIISGRAALSLSPMRSMLFQRGTALMFFVMAAAFVLLPVYYSGNIPSVFSWLRNLDLPNWTIKVSGIFFLAVILLAAICLLIGTVKARRPESTLLILLLTVTLFSYPMSTMTMPSLDQVLSSKSASVEIQRYVGLGYYPISFGVYPGAFSYYSEQVVYETADWSELDRLVDLHPKVIVVMSASRWANWNTHPGLTEIMRFWMLSNEYVLLLRNTFVEQEQGLPEDFLLPDEEKLWRDELEGQTQPVLPPDETLLEVAPPAGETAESDKSEEPEAVQPALNGVNGGSETLGPDAEHQPQPAPEEPESPSGQDLPEILEDPEAEPTPADNEE